LLESESMASVESEHQSDSDNNEESSSESTPNLEIQWETLRDFITWTKIGDMKGQKDEYEGTAQGPPESQESRRMSLSYRSPLSLIPNASFDELSNCMVKIPRKHIGDELAPFIRNHHQEQSEMVVSHWLRMIQMDVMDDISSIIDSFYVNHDYDGETLSVSADWTAPHSPLLLEMNQSRFFKELQSISDGDDTKDIVGVTLHLVKTVKGYSSWTESTTTLHLSANGSYVFEDKEWSTWAEGEAESAGEGVSNDVAKHCGVWDYNGDEIVMEGFGFANSWGSEDDMYESDDDETKPDNTFSTRLAIQRPVAVETRASCEKWYGSDRCDRCNMRAGPGRLGIYNKCRRTEKSNLSVFVYF